MSLRTVDPNTVTPSAAAISTICAYPLGKLRKDMSIQEYTVYKMDWEIFNKVWAYNYTISTLNGTARNNKYSYYQFLTLEDQVSYIRGQAAHVAFYVNKAPVGQFATIR